jgi:hypothetical protein
MGFKAGLSTFPKRDADEPLTCGTTTLQCCAIFKKEKALYTQGFQNGRADWIRTSDLLTPSQAR